MQQQVSSENIFIATAVISYRGSLGSSAGLGAMGPDPAHGHPALQSRSLGWVLSREPQPCMSHPCSLCEGDAAAGLGQLSLPSVHPLGSCPFQNVGQRTANSPPSSAELLCTLLIGGREPAAPPDQPQVFVP